MTAFRQVFCYSCIFAQVTLEEKPSALESDSLLENEEYEEDDSGDMVKSPVHNILTENQGHIGL